MSDWDPKQYLRFGKERTRPVYDLTSHIGLDEPRRILDIGCGPGNSTAVLEQRWPGAHIIGLDSSESMIKKAKEDHPNIEFVSRDACDDLSDLGDFDIVFSNASLQWMPDHPSLIPRLFGMLRERGTFAAQIPQFDRMPASQAIDEVVASDEWRDYFLDFKSGLVHNPDELYYDILCERASSIDIWATEYHHIMPDHQAIVSMLSSTGLRPYLERLNREKARTFKEAVLENLVKRYPTRVDGKVLFPFKRLFIVASR
ncbi:methyltransferase domain-containing protein [Methanomassiliicoccus luminyensis]|uniref:methyltransferase domain-containing protein n=1 Tax=Methanomassiliicoccus luminyensis TaxID=1080712 RepID=UPI000474DF75|nr:methyltransferase domain-containing protein [Methanomassiliicoccus luminyensis]